MAAPAQGRCGAPAGQSVQGCTTQTQRSRCPAVCIMSARRPVECHTTTAAQHRGTARTDPCRNPCPCAERERLGLETPMPHQTKRRDAFAQPSQEIQQLRGQAQPGEIESAYLDEAGVVQLHSNRSAWMPRRTHHLIDAPRSKRLNGMAALLNRGSVVNSLCRCSSTAELFPCFVADRVRGVNKPTSSCSTTPRSIALRPFGPNAHACQCKVPGSSACRLRAWSSTVSRRWGA